MSGFSLFRQLERAASLHADKRALVFEDVSYTWSELLLHTHGLAAGLQDTGVRSGDRVAILALNCDHYFSLYYAIPAIGAIAVPVNIRLAEAEVVQSLADCGANTLIVDDAFTDMVPTLRSHCPQVTHYLYVGSRSCPEGLHSLLPADRVDDGGAVFDRAHRDVAALFYTGGTTGRPKGVKLTHQGMVFNTLQWIVATGTRSDDNLLIPAPMFHMVAGLNCIAAGTLAATLTILPRFEVALVLKTIQDQKITKTALVPAMIDMLVRDQSLQDYDISALQRISYGGAPMPEEILKRAQAAMPKVQFMQIYGQTECCGSVTCLPNEYHVIDGPGADKRRSAGRPMVGTEVVIQDNSGRHLRTGEAGEICVRSPAASPGYWDNEAETQALYRDGWLLTGDIGYLDRDGFLFVVDRLKDMIVSGGENVFATEVENVIYLLTDVEQCAVIGIPSEQWGEQVHAVVKCREGSDLNEAKLIEHCRKHLAGFKCARSVEFREQPLPVSAMNKILKQELKAPWWKGQSRKV